MIQVEFLEKYGAELLSFTKGINLFEKGEQARYYFQLLEGEVKMYNLNEDGKEFIQGIFSRNRSFGEPPLFSADSRYLSHAITLSDSKIYRLSKQQFHQLLLEHPAIHLEFTKTLAERLYFKSLMAAEISNNDPETRILTLLNYLKFTIYKMSEPFSYEVELTRQQIADLTGLRVETVIRSIKTLEKKGTVKIINRKVIY